MTDDLHDYLEFAKQLAAEAGEMMLHYFNLENIGASDKDDNSPVTIADREINRLVIDKVKEKFPEHGVMGEEEIYNPDATSLWITDPVDGTIDFVLHMPLSAFSLALVVNGVTQVGVVFNPYLKKMYWAVLGQGSYLNGNKLDISNRQPRKTRYISTWIDGRAKASFIKNPEVAPAVARVYSRTTNIITVDYPIAYALCMVASGDLDGMITACSTPWDLSAGALIASEANAKVTNLLAQDVGKWNTEIQGMCAAGEQVHNELISLLMPVIKDYL